MVRRLLVLATASVVFVAVAATAIAGGAATSIVQAPDEFQAGESYDVTYSVLQHGETPIEGETALLFSQDDSEALRFEGTPTGTPGEYIATVELPNSGAWLIEVDQAAFGVVQHDMIEVVDSSFLSLSGEVLAIVAVVAAAGWLVLALRRTRRDHRAASPVASEM